MISTLGVLGVTIALAASLGGIGLLGVGLVTDRPHLRRMGARYGWLVLVGSTLSVVAMQWALLTDDASVAYVFEESSTLTPLIYKVTTMWSALEGSLLLWGLVLAGYLGAVLHKFRARITDPMVGWALVTMLVVAVFFFGIILGPANPFGRVDVPEGWVGQGPNPLLQNHVLVAFHPPMLYLGYVGFTVPFAFAIGALVTGRVGEGWLLETRRWTLFAWGFLTAGILLGAWWAYDVLGWGGYWGWDPVENASILPWFTGTAYLHSVLVQERRGMLRVWNLSLVCATFALTIFGTFITRSGVVISVHAFSEGSIGPLLLGFLAAVCAVTVGLIYVRGDRLRAPGRIDSPFSRESAFLANNLVFAAFAFIVLLGTVAPLIIEALQNRRISVGAPYYENMTMPVALVMLFLMAVAPVLPWRKASDTVLRDRLEWPAWMGTASVVVAVLLGARGIAELVAYGLAGFAAGSALRQLVLATRRQGWRGLVGRANGGMVVHLGVILVAVALAASGGNLRQGEFDFELGETRALGGHELTYRGSQVIDHPNRTEQQVTIELDGNPMAPAVVRYKQTGQVVRTPDTTETLGENVQVAILVEPETQNGPISIRATAQPLVSWLWIGGLVMLVGTAMSAFPTSRQRRPTSPVSAPVPVEAAP